jgi:hypothetical protein
MIIYLKCLSLNISTQVILTFICHLQTEMLHQSLLQTFFLLRILMTTLVIVAKSILTMKCYTLALLHVSPIFLMLLVVVQQLFSCIFSFKFLHSLLFCNFMCFFFLCNSLQSFNHSFLTHVVKHTTNIKQKCFAKKLQTLRRNLMAIPSSHFFF